jgi:hypothetical protein
MHQPNQRNMDVTVTKGTIVVNGQRFDIFSGFMTASEIYQSQEFLHLLKLNRIMILPEIYLRLLLMSGKGRRIQRR